MANPFSKFTSATKKLVIKELDNQEVTIRTLSIDETDMFANMMIGEGIDGKVSFNYKSMAEVTKRKVAASLVDPVMTYEEINALPANAIDAIKEIADAIEEFNAKGKKKS